jgi:hypothetical protein
MRGEAGQGFAVGLGEAVVVHQPQGLARRIHAVVLPLERAFLRFETVPLREFPGAVDGPVAEGAVSVVLRDWAVRALFGGEEVKSGGGWAKLTGRSAALGV